MDSGCPEEHVPTWKWFQEVFLVYRTKHLLPRHIFKAVGGNIGRRVILLQSQTLSEDIVWLGLVEAKLIHHKKCHPNNRKGVG